MSRVIPSFLNNNNNKDIKKTNKNSKNNINHQLEQHYSSTLPLLSASRKMNAAVAATGAENQQHDQDTILDYSCKYSKTVSPKSDYDHNIVTIMSDNNNSNNMSPISESKNQDSYKKFQKQDQREKSAREGAEKQQQQQQMDLFRTQSRNNNNSNANKFYNHSNYDDYQTTANFMCKNYGQFPNSINYSIRCLVNEQQQRQQHYGESVQEAQQRLSIERQSHINILLPELLTHIFSYLSTADKGNVAQVCQYWHEISYEKKLWKGIEAKVHLNSKGNSTLYASLTKRGIHQLQILSLKKSLRELFIGLPRLTSLKLSGCYNVTDWTLFSTFNLNGFSNTNLLELQQQQTDQNQSSSSRTRLYPPNLQYVAAPPSAQVPQPPLLHSLTTLDLSLCKQISDISLGRIAIRAPNLQNLELGGCSQITDRGLLIIAWGFKQLLKLNLRSCHLVTDAGISYLAGFVLLEHLHEPKTFDFLTKFGLLQLRDDHERNGSKDRNELMLNNDLRNNSLKNYNSMLEYDDSYKIPSKRFHSSNVSITNNTLHSGSASKLSTGRRQQCVLCRQLIVVPKSSTSTAGFVPGFGPTATSLPETELNSTSRKRKLVCKKYLMSTTLENCQNSSDNNASPSSSTGFEKIGPNTVFGTSRLQTLVLQDCQKLTDACLSYISPPSESESFSFSSDIAQDVSFNNSTSSAKGLLALQSINLSFCIHVTDSGLKQLAKLPQLHELNLRSCDSITDIGLVNLKECGGTLLSLDISFCDKINNLGLHHISNWMNGLTLLSISSCNISDSGLIRIASSLTQLETLHLGQCSKITDESIKCIAQKCEKLKYIDLYGCNMISREGLEICSRMPNIVNLNLGLWHLG